MFLITEENVEQCIEHSIRKISWYTTNTIKHWVKSFRLSKRFLFDFNSVEKFVFEYTNSVIDILPDEVESSKTIWINQWEIQENESSGLYLFSLPQFYKEEIKKTG